MVMKACTALDQELYIYRLDVSMSSLDRDVDRGNETEAWYSPPYPCSTPQAHCPACFSSTCTSRHKHTQDVLLFRSVLSLGKNMLSKLV